MEIIMETRCSTLAQPAIQTRLRPMNKGAALWLQGLILLTLMAASSAPTPLYGIYRESWGFSAITLTIVFAVYAASVLLALLVLGRSEEHTSELQSLMRISYSVFCLKKK